jgi:hypothetical protein
MFADAVLRGSLNALVAEGYFTPEQAARFWAQWPRLDELN